MSIIAKGLQDRSHTEWDELVQPALFAIRTCVHDSSRYTPPFLTYGRDPVLPLDALLKPRRRYYGEDYVPTVLQRLHSAFTSARDNTRSAREIYTYQYNKKVRQHKFEVGNPVFFHNLVVEINHSRKFRSPWKLYYRIVEMISQVTAVIRCQKTDESKTVHVNNLRLANIDNI